MGQNAHRNSRDIPAVAAARTLLNIDVEQALCSNEEMTKMKYGLAWLLGIPIPILAVIYLVSHC